MTKYCPNPKCPTRERDGRAAEYVDGVDRCAECGASLVDVNPTPTGRHAPWPAPLRQRLWVTGQGAVLVLLASHLPSPFVDFETAGEAMKLPWYRLGLQVGPFALGLAPMLGGFVLVELAALVVPAWNRRRHGDPGFRHTLLMRSLVVGLLLALLQGYFVAQTLESVGRDPFAIEGAIVLINEPGLAFKLQYALTAATGTLLLALGALVISRHGVGNGFAVLFLVELVRGIPVGLYDHWSELFRDLSIGGLIFGGALSLILLGGILLSFLRPPHLTREGMMVILPTCGILPFELGPLLLLQPALLSFIVSPWFHRLVDVTSPGTERHIFIQLFAILIFVPLGSWLYWWRFRDRLRRPGQRMAWIGSMLWSAALLGALALLWHGFLPTMPHPATSRLTLLWLIPVVVILVDLVAEIRARREAPNAADLVPLAEYQHPAEALMDARGRAPEVGAVVQGLRFRTMHYFFAPQVPCRVLGVPLPAPPVAEISPPDEGGKACSRGSRSPWERVRLRRGWTAGRSRNR